MVPRRHVLHGISSAWVLGATVGCGGRTPTTPSDDDTGASDPVDSAARDTAGRDTGADDSALDTGSGDTASPDACVPTEDDIEGPFYRAGAPERDDLVVPGDTGTPLRLSGRVRTADGCAPIAGAVVDVWHADPAGAYDNASSAWRYRGRVTTSPDGAWQLRTLEPGRYLNGAQYRPSHVHLKVWVDGVERLTTQLYFPDDPYNALDPWYAPELEVTRTGDGAARFDLVV